MMKKLVSASLFCIAPSFLALGLISEVGSAQDLGGGGQAGGRQVEGGVERVDRAITRDDIVDNRAATNTGENNATLGGGQNQANNMNFLNALFGGNIGNQNVNQNTPLRGRGIRAPFRLGFKFDGLPWILVSKT